jgi:hypothetical protein
MPLAGAILLAAIGAIFTFAISDSIEGVDLGTIGVILMIAGAVGAILEGFRQAYIRRDREHHSERVVNREGEPAQREEVHERY